ncbi:hypothetical protein R5R35_004375 [Gryllus longicercus]|uniref:Uncharacterized protein n=1 Tax=Gryllus longicercus TaxID=2509291 RepID=A0AAN9YY41_9ORTH
MGETNTKAPAAGAALGGRRARQPAAFLPTLVHPRPLTPYARCRWLRCSPALLTFSYPLVSALAGSVAILLALTPSSCSSSSPAVLTFCPLNLVLLCLTLLSLVPSPVPQLLTLLVNPLNLVLLCPPLLARLKFSSPSISTSPALLIFCPLILVHLCLTLLSLLPRSSSYRLLPNTAPHPPC